MRGSIPALLSAGVADGQRVVLMDGRQPVEGRLEGSNLGELGRQLLASLDALAPEREVARSLASVLEGPNALELRTRLGGLKSQAEAGRMPLRVLVDARTEALRALPWEVLESVDPRVLPVAQWIRLAQAGSANASLAGFSRSSAPSVRRSVLEVVLWSPDPEDPLVNGVMVRLEAMVRGLSGATCLRLPRDSGRLAPLPPAQVFRVLHVVSSSARSMAKVEWGSLKPGLLPSGLCPSPAGAGLVVLDPVGAGPEFGGEAMEELAPRFVAGGSPACVAVRPRQLPDASVAFARGLYHALLTGQDLVDAVGEGRKALRASHLPWWSALLLVAEPAVAQAAPPLRRLPLPGNWPASTPEVDEVLDQAVELASGYGFLGVEHLAAALVRHPRPGPLVAMALPGFQLVAALLVPTESDGRVRLTARMEALVRRLRDGFTLEELVTEIVEIPWVSQILGASTMGRLRALTVRPGVTPEEITEQRPPAAKGVFFEVTGGPDDGRTLSLIEADQVLGRWDPSSGPPTLLPGDDPTQGETSGSSASSTNDGARLFLGARVVERTVSRRHLSFVPPRSIRANGPTQLQRGETSKPVKGEVELRVGDRLLLGVGTRLLVVA